MEFDSVIAEHTDNITTALTGGGLDDCQSSCGSGGPPGRPLATGQTACWDSAGQTIACGGTGQDGELQKGLPRAYVDNGNGTITDTQSGLMWEKLSDDGSVHDRDNLYTWDDVFAGKLAVLNGSGGFAGHADWRVPNVTELQSLLDYGAVSPAVDVAFNSGCAPGCSVTMCSCTGLGSYWSSSTYQPQRSWAWIGYSTGVVGGEPKTFDHAVRAVRGR